MSHLAGHMVLQFMLNGSFPAFLFSQTGLLSSVPAYLFRVLLILSCVVIGGSCLGVTSVVRPITLLLLCHPWYLLEVYCF